MMTLSKGMTAGHAGGYFSREDYYLGGAEDPGASLWYGKGAQALGLTGPVSPEDFRAVCRGEAPGGGTLVASGHGRDPKATELIEVRRAGNDATFSAPKSVSIAYVAGVQGVKEAHDAAVLSVLDHIEQHYCHYRHAERAESGELVAAKFDHATSRSIDPQLHSHVFLVNVARTPDGSFRANTTDLFFRNQKRLGRLYRQELAHELAGRGFQVTVKDRARLFIELKGIDPALIQTRNLERLIALPSFQSTASPSSVDWLIERVSEEEGRPLTAGQKAEVFNELTGDPGTAKTTTLRNIERFNERVLCPYGEEHLSIKPRLHRQASTGKSPRPPGDLPAPSTVSKTPTRLPNLSYRGKNGSRLW